MKANPKRQPGTKWTKDSYRRSIVRAAKKASVEHWTPYQLRHLCATEVREALDVEASQALMGQSSVQMAAHYARIKDAKAIEAAKAAPRLIVG